MNIQLKITSKQNSKCFFRSFSIWINFIDNILMTFDLIDLSIQFKLIMSIEEKEKHCKHIESIL